MFLCLLLWEYRKDCKEIGKENLAVPLSERLLFYFIYFVFPVSMVLLTKLLKGG